MSIARILQQAASNAVPPDPAWNLAYASFNGGVYGHVSVAAQAPSPIQVSFKSDGTKMYVLCATNDAVYEYNLSTAWEVSTATYLQSFSVSSQDTSPEGLFFKPDGTKMYICGVVGDDINEYDLSSAWDVSTASYVRNFSVFSEDGNPEDVFFKPDGTKMYMLGATGDDVNEYNLSTAWNISTASYLQTFSIAAQDTSPEGLFFKPDGTKMYVSGNAGDDVNEYDLSTAWDISTASYVQSFALFPLEFSTMGVFFKSDGTKMYVSGLSGVGVWQFSLSSAWDVSTASWDAPTQNYFSVLNEENNAGGVFFKPDGTKMYVVGSGGDEVNEYDLSTAWAISTASYLQTFSVVSQDTVPTDIFFKPDGTKMYVIGSTGDSVYEYDLSTAWNISTASYLQAFSVSAEELAPSGLAFKPDGTKMYVIGSAGDDVNEYDLSTAWDISTASYLQAFSVAAQETSPLCLFFKPDGTKMYIGGSGGDDITGYDLSTAWDVSTASFVNTFRVAVQDAAPTGLFFKPDGTKMYVAGPTSDAIWAYDLSL